MTVSISSMHIHSGDVVIISVPEVKDSIVNDAKGIKHLLEVYGIPEPLVLVKSHNETIEALDLDVMAAHGWYRMPMADFLPHKEASDGT